MNFSTYFLRSAQQSNGWLKCQLRSLNLIFKKTNLKQMEMLMKTIAAKLVAREGLRSILIYFLV